MAHASASNLRVPSISSLQLSVAVNRFAELAADGQRSSGINIYSDSEPWLGGAAMPKKRRTARFNRTISLSAKRPMRTPTFAFGTVVILSTMSRQTMRSPLPSLGSIRRRNRGALLGSVVNAHTVTELVMSKRPS